MEGGRFYADSPLFENSYSMPGEEEAWIHGIIKASFLGDLIFDSERKVKSALKDLHELIFSKVSQIKKTLLRISQINRLRSNFDLRLEHIRHSKLDRRTLRMVLNKSKEGDSKDESSQLTSGSWKNPKNDTTKKSDLSKSEDTSISSGFNFRDVRGRNIRNGDKTTNGSGILKAINNNLKKNTLQNNNENKFGRNYTNQVSKKNLKRSTVMSAFKFEEEKSSGNSQISKDSNLKK